MTSLAILVSYWAVATAFAGPCRDAVSDADVVFTGRALETHGADTEMEVVRVERGKIPYKRITFKHAVAHQEFVVGRERRYFVLNEGETYRLFAKKTTKANIFSELWGIDYCGDSISPVPPDGGASHK